MCTKTQNCEPCWYFRQLPGPKNKISNFSFSTIAYLRIFNHRPLWGLKASNPANCLNRFFFVDRPIAYDAFPSLLSFSLSLCRHLWSTPSICSMCRCGLLNPISKDCFWIPKGRDILSSPPHLWDSPPRQRVTCCKPSTCQTSSHHTQSPEL